MPRFRQHRKNGQCLLITQAWKTAGVNGNSSTLPLRMRRTMTILCEPLVAAMED